MIDIHCHILPNIDDGSRDEEHSLQQLRSMAEGGISRVYLTSHYFRGHYQYTRAEYDAKFDRLSGLVKAELPELELLPGFEVYIQPGILEDIEEHNLCLGDSRYVLIESELNGLPTDFYFNIYPILRKGFRPILAHAERYVSIMKDPAEAQKYLEQNIYIQVNAGSLMGLYGEKVKETAIKLVEEGWVHFIASDDHVRSDYKAYFSAREWITEHIDATTAELLTHDYPGMIQDGIHVPYKYVKVIKPRHRHHKRSLWEKMFGVS